MHGQNFFHGQHFAERLYAILRAGLLRKQEQTVDLVHTPQGKKIRRFPRGPRRVRRAAVDDDRPAVAYGRSRTAPGDIRQIDLQHAAPRYSRQRDA